MNEEAIKGWACSAIAHYNAAQRSTVDQIDIAPWSMQVINEYTVIQNTIREEVVILKPPVGGEFRVASRLKKM